MYISGRGKIAGTIDIEKHQKIKERFGWSGSWAIWAPRRTAKPKDGISDLSVLDPTKNANLLDTLHANYIAVGLNISRAISGPAFSNFHGRNPRATEYKIRHAFEGTPLWGASALLSHPAWHAPLI